MTQQESPLHFSDESMFTIINMLKAQLETMSECSFTVLNPDSYGGHYAGKEVIIEGQTYIYRSLRAWMDLATLLKCRMLTPTVNNSKSITLHFEKLRTDSFHQDNPTDKSEIGRAHV